MNTGRVYSPEQWAQAKRMYEAGEKLGLIRARTGISRTRLHVRLVEGVEGQGPVVRYRDPHPHMTLEEEARLFASLPKDTRSFTARAMGDPLPGRSALDRRAP